MRRRTQKGSLWKCRGWWYLRYRDSQVVNGKIIRVQVAKRLAPTTGETRSRESRLLQTLAAEVLKPINAMTTTPDALLTIGQFAEQHFLPMIREQRRPSTYATVESYWRNQLQARVGDFKLRDFSTRDGVEAMKLMVRQQSDIHRSYLKQIKSTLSAIFKFARQLGLLDRANPMQDVPVPQAVKSTPRGEYRLEEIQRILQLLDGRERAVIAVAALTGLRRGEIQGLQWPDYTGDEIYVRRTCWQGHLGDTKTDASTAAIPVIAPLRKILDQHRAQCGNPVDGFVFHTRTGGWINLQKVAAKITPTLKAAGLEWKGWHGFRHGLGSNLYRLGVADKHIQQILRHSNLATTLEIYVCASNEDSISAMARLEHELEKTTPQIVQ